MKKKPKTKRSKEKYPALKANLNLKTRYEQYDQDYIDGVKDDGGNTVIRPLSKDEKDWLNRFNEEYINANFKHKGERIHEKVIEERFVKYSGKNRKYDVTKNELEQLNNSRNRCIYTKAKASHQMDYLEDLKYDQAKESPEDEIIEQLTLKEKKFDDTSD